MTLAFEPVFDPDLTPTSCPECGDPSASPGGCPFCRSRESVDPGAVPAGPWPRLVLVRGEPLPGGELWFALPGGGRELDLGDGPVAHLEADGERVTLIPLADARLDGAPLAPGMEVPLSVGMRLAIGGRELVLA